MARRRSRKTRTESPAEIVSSNEDLMFKILQLLPVMILFPLKLVSKQWRSAIERCLLRTIPLGLFLYETFSSKYKFLPLLYDDLSITNLKSVGIFAFQSGMKILHSCYGLLCCSTENPIEFTAEFFIYNPTTKQYTPLPRRSKGTSFSSVIYGMTLSYDPAISPFYKVVSVQSSSISSKQYWVEIYSPETGWQAYGEPFTPTGEPMFKNGVYWNGAVHWISDQGDSFYFDIAQGKVSKMLMPPNRRRIRKIRYFGESKGRLFLVDSYKLDSMKFKVYELKKDYSKWLVRYQVDLTSIASVFPNIIIDDKLGRYRVVILTIYEGGTEEESFLVLRIKGLIIRYMFNDKNYKIMRICDDSLRFPGWFCAHPYFKSLDCI